MKIGDLVRHRIGSINELGVIMQDCEDGDYLVLVENKIFPTDYKTTKCRRSSLEVICRAENKEC